MKHVGWFIVVMVLLIAVPQGVSSKTPPPQPPEKASVISERVLEQAQQRSSVRVIVRLDVDARVEADLPSPQAVREQQNTIAAAQQQLLHNLPAGAVSHVRTYTTIPFVAMSVDSSALEALAQAPGVAYVAPDTKRKLALRESIAVIGADVAHDRGFSGKGWTVAVIDSGVETTHPFLANKVVAEACFSTNDPGDGLESVCPNGQSQQIGPGAAAPCTFEESCEHGTHVAGIVAGKGSDIVGVASDATLIAIQAASKALGEEGPEPTFLDSDIIAGMEYAYNLRDTYHIAAVNLSLGYGEYTSVEACDAADGPIYRDMVDNLRAADIAVIAVSGNDELPNAMNSPGCISGIISVGAVDDGDIIADFSNVAPFLDFFAPGVNIESSVLNGQFVGIDGTSQATPHVAGAWAVLKQANPTASVDEILEKLKTTGVPIPSADGTYTTPRIQIDAALEQGPNTGIRAPSNLMAGAGSSRNHPADVALVWQDNSDNETGFRIERARYESSDVYEGWGEWELIGEVGADATMYQDITVQCGWEGYRYRVQAVSGTMMSNYSNIAEVTTWACPIPGDCNNDESVLASDMGAIALEIADERFDYFGCDANRDMVINKADIVCTAQLIFGLRCETATTSSIGITTPSQEIDDPWEDDPNIDDPWEDDPNNEVPPAATLAVPVQLTVQPNQRFTVPITLSVHDGTISSLGFRLLYDESLLTFDRNAPDAIRFAGLPAGFSGMAPVDETVLPGSIPIAVTDQEAPLEGLPDGTVVAEITFLANGRATSQSTRLTIVYTSFGNDQGKTINGTSQDGTVEIAAEGSVTEKPQLTLPAEVTTDVTEDESQVAEIPVLLYATGNELKRVGFMIEYDDWLELDGVVVFPKNMLGTASSDPSYGEGKLFIEVEMTEEVPFADDSDGVEVARLPMKLLANPPSPAAPSVRFSQTVSAIFIDMNGNPVEGEVSGGTIIRGALTPQPPEPPTGPSPVYLPIIRQ